MNTLFTETQERWDTFLNKIEQRFNEVLTQSEALLPNILELQDFDPTPINVAWQGIETQAKDLISKINNTWTEKVSPAFDEVKDAGEESVTEQEGSLDAYYEEFYKLYYPEQEKGLVLAKKLERAFKGYEVRTFATAARKLHQKALEVLSKTFQCTQCQAPLPVRQNFFRSYYENCSYCQTVNTFEPGTMARNVEHFALHALAEEKALDAYYAYWDLEDKFKGQHDDEPPVVDKDTLLETYSRYAEKYLKARIEIIPDLQNQYEKDLKAKVEHVRKWVLGEHGWNYTNPLDKSEAEETDTDESDISREMIKDIIWQMIAYYYPEGGTLEGEDIGITEDTVLGDLENNMDFIMEDFEDTFLVYVEDAESLTVNEIIDYLYERSEEIELGENVDADGHWTSFQEMSQEDDDE